MRFAIIGLLFACGDKEETNDTLDLIGDAVAGETLYTTNCSSCHAADATGGSGPDITNSVATEGEVAVKEIIEQGKDGMPAITALDEQGVADVIAFLKTLET